MGHRTENNTIALLLSGKHPQAKKFSGRHVLVVDQQVIALKKGQTGATEIEHIEKKYGKTPTLVFVPRQDISYILVCL